MTGVIDLKVTFLDTLELRGVPGSEHELYARALGELASFLQSSPQSWARADLERFLRLRAPLLSAREMAAYGHALGIVTELIERLAGEYTTIRFEADVSLETSESDPMLEHEDRTDFLAETLERIVARPRTAPSPVPATPASAPPLMIGDRAPSVPLRRVEQTDFLAENIHDWREKTGRRNRQPVRTTGSLSPVRTTGPLTQVARSEPPLDGREQRAPAVDSDSSSGGDAALACRWSPGGWIELDWQGFVAGQSLRRTLEQAVTTLQARGGCSVLADMREASVLSQGDADWFAEWLQRSAVEHGLRRFAIVNPQRVISRMQLSRLRHLADASSVSLPDTRRLQIAFFDVLREAREWLMQP